MANLAEAVDATETDWIISADVSDAIDYFTVEDEIVKVTGNFPAGRDPQTLLPVAPRLRVERGAGGTTAVSHADATALTPLIPPSSSSGGVAMPDPGTGSPGDVPTVNEAEDGYELGARAIEVDNFIDPITLIELINAPGAVIAGTVATLATPAEGLVDGVLQSTTVIGDGWEAGWAIDPDTGDLALTAGLSRFTLRVDGSFTLLNFDEDTSIAGAADGTITIVGPNGNSITLGATFALNIQGIGDVLEIAANGTLTLVPAALLAIGLPSADPEVAGQFYTDGVVSAGVPQPLMISGGPA